jgi:outer membrane protein
MVIRLILPLLLLMCFTQSFAQQRYGHLNTGNILESMPTVAFADSTLKMFSKELEQKEDDMIAEFEKDYEAFAKKAQSGELPKITIDKKQQEFQRREQEIIAFQKEVQQKITQRRKDLLDPILKSLQETINKIAIDNGYAYIFDISTGAFMYARESDNIEPLVRTAMGLQP